jgi:hypothetical protein
VLAAWATPRLRLSAAALRGGVLVLVGWTLFAVLAPTVLGIDHAGLRSIYDAGDHTAFNLKLHSGSTYPLKTLALVAAAAGLLSLGAMRLLRNQPASPRERRGASGSGSRAQPALSA